MNADPFAGYTFVVNVRVLDEHIDWQGHLNNSAAVKLLENGRIRYIDEGLGSDVRTAIAEQVVMMVRELHVLYESEGRPGERFRCGVRPVRRTHKALTLEQVLAEKSTGRVVVRAWVVMLMGARDGSGAVELPPWFTGRMDEYEGRTVPVVPPGPRPPWGPPT